MTRILVLVDNQQYHDFDRADIARYHTTTNEIYVGGSRFTPGAKVAYPFTLTMRNGNKYTFYTGNTIQANELVEGFFSNQDVTWDLSGELNLKYSQPISLPGLNTPALTINVGTKSFAFPVGLLESFNASGGFNQPGSITLVSANPDIYVDSAGTSESNATYTFHCATSAEALSKRDLISDMVYGLSSLEVVDFDPALNAHLL